MSHLEVSNIARSHIYVILDGVSWVAEETREKRRKVSCQITVISFPRELLHRSDPLFDAVILAIAAPTFRSII